MLCVEKSCEYLAVRGMVRLFWEWGRGFGGGCGGGVMVGICYLVVMSWISINHRTGLREAVARTRFCEKLRGVLYDAVCRLGD